jgi:hypothetical protein
MPPLRAFTRASGPNSQKSCQYGKNGQIFFKNIFNLWDICGMRRVTVQLKVGYRMQDIKGTSIKKI